MLFFGQFDEDNTFILAHGEVLSALLLKYIFGSSVEFQSLLNIFLEVTFMSW